MRIKIPDKLEQGRLLDADIWSSTAADGPLGLFHIMGPAGTELRILSSGHDSEYMWEHVSVSTRHRTPNWIEMCFVKDLFWDDEEAVMQLHPPRSDYVNHHPFTLHLWRPMQATIPLPPSILVGPKS
jgi:hypothetical protein